MKACRVSYEYRGVNNDSCVRDVARVLLTGKSLADSSGEIGHRSPLLRERRWELTVVESNVLICTAHCDGGGGFRVIPDVDNRVVRSVIRISSL